MRGDSSSWGPGQLSVLCSVGSALHVISPLAAISACGAAEEAWPRVMELERLVGGAAGAATKTSFWAGDAVQGRGRLSSPGKVLGTVCPCTRRTEPPNSGCCGDVPRLCGCSVLAVKCLGFHGDTCMGVLHHGNGFGLLLYLPYCERLSHLWPVAELCSAGSCCRQPRAPRGIAVCPTKPSTRRELRGDGVSQGPPAPGETASSGSEEEPSPCQDQRAEHPQAAVCFSWAVCALAESELVFLETVPQLRCSFSVNQPNSFLFYPITF